MTNKYWLSFLLGLRGQIAERGQLIGRMISYMIIIYLFSQIFHSVDASNSRIWYIAFTQVVISSTSSIVFDIAEDLQDGKMTYYLGMPLSYFPFKLCEAIGVSTVRYALFFTLALLWTPLFLGEFYLNVTKIGVGFVIGFLSVILLTLTTIIVGLLAHWMKEIKSLYYVNLTAAFSFGGLIVPLDFYSSTMRHIADFLPYKWMLWWPAGVLTGCAIPIGSAFAKWTIWTALFWILTAMTYKLVVSSIEKGDHS